MVKELVQRGFNVVAFARERSGMVVAKGKRAWSLISPVLRFASVMSPSRIPWLPRPLISPPMW